MSDSEWYGEPHTLTVHSVRSPDGPLDDGELDYDLEHPPSCRQEEHGEGERAYMAWTCDVAGHAGEGLSFSLRYSGTPVTEPGTYRIQGWGRKTYCHAYGAYEYDGGVGVMDPEAVAFDARWQQVTCRTCKRTYTCTPEDDYYGGAGETRPLSATSGLCFGCTLTAGGLNPEVTPVRVIDLTGRGSDPRDLSRNPAGGAS